MSESNRVGIRIVREGAQATDNLDFPATPLDDEIVTIGSTVYTFKTTLTPTAYEVLIGADATAARDNLVNAINGFGVSGTDYATGTEPHPDVYAVTEGTGGDSLDVYAKLYGTDGNAIVATTDVTSAVWLAGTGTLENGSAKGVTPTNSVDWLGFCYTSEDLSAGNQYDRSERICAEVGGAARLQRKRALASIQPSGSINFELMYGPLLKDLLESVFQGMYLAEQPAAGQNQVLVDITQRNYTIEKYYDELNRFEHWTGAMLNQLQISIPFGSKATGVAQFAARDHDATASSSLVGTGTVTGEPSNEILTGSRDFTGFEVDDAPIPGLVISQIDLSFSNNGRPRNGLGSQGPTDHKSGDATMTGSISMYLNGDVFTEYRDALTNTDKKLEFGLTDPAGNLLHFVWPSINFTADPPSVPGRNQDVMWTAPFEAHTSVPYMYYDDV